MITLSSVMKANAISCIVFGSTFLFFYEEVKRFLSVGVQVPNTVLILLGAVLFFNGLHLMWASLKSKPSQYLVLYFSIGDAIWVIISVFLLLTGIWITTPLGIVVTLIVSAMVGAFGWLQMLTYKVSQSIEGD